MESEQGVQESPLVSFLKEVNENDIQTGICSRRVQGLINSVHRQRDVAPISVKIGDPTLDGDITEQRNLFAIGPKDSSWQLYAEETGQPGAVQQDIYFGDTTATGEIRGMRIFSFLEKANEDRCSVSLCWPAAIEDLEWAIVVTVAEEGKPVTIDESLKDVPQTNARILDELLGIIASGDDPAGLAETLHLNELLERAFPPAAPQLEKYASLTLSSPRAALARKLGDLGAWSVLAGGFVPQGYEYRQGEHIRFQVLNDKITVVEHVDENLGTVNRIRPLGSIMIDPKTNGVAFESDPDLITPTPAQAVEEALRYAESVFQVPEIYEHPTLAEGIDRVINDVIAGFPRNQHAKIFKEKMEKLLRSLSLDEFSRRDGGEMIVRFGTIDISRLGPGVYLDGREFHGISADVFANREQTVFANVEQLYECSVRGAEFAFKEVGGRRLLAEDCKYAFGRSKVSESVAYRIGRAFFGKGQASNCIAQSCKSAFTGYYGSSGIKPDGDEKKPTQDVTYSLAVDCTNAFHKLSGGSRDLTAQFCPKYTVFFRHVNAMKRIKKKERTRQNMVSIDILDRYSPISAYKAGRRFGRPPAKPKSRFLNFWDSIMN